MRQAGSQNFRVRIAGDPPPRRSTRGPVHELNARYKRYGGHRQTIATGETTGGTVLTFSFPWTVASSADWPVPTSTASVILPFINPARQSSTNEDERVARKQPATKEGPRFPRSPSPSSGEEGSGAIDIDDKKYPISSLTRDIVDGTLGSRFIPSASVHHEPCGSVRFRCRYAMITDMWTIFLPGCGRRALISRRTPDLKPRGGSDTLM